MIFIFSTDLGSYNNVGGFLLPFLLSLIPDLTSVQIDHLLLAIRKVAHLAEYFILSIFWGRALSPKITSERRSSLGAIALCAIWAALDEYHQSFVASRTASIVDLGIDLIGVLLGQTPGLVAAQWRRLSLRKTRAAQFFGWWFAWGVFSAVMLLIVWRGGPFGVGGMIVLISIIGLLSGTVGVFCGVRR